MNPAPASAQHLHLEIKLNPENPRCIAATPSLSPVGTAFASASPGDRRFPKPRYTRINDGMLHLHERFITSQVRDDTRWRIRVLRGSDGGGPGPSAKMWRF